MCRRLIFTLVVCLVFTTVSSIRCYAGTDKQCMMAPNMNDCGGETCQCVKYRFQCTQDDQACDKREQVANTKKWAYTVLGKSTCQMLRTPNGGYENVTCCATDGCNRPDSGKCSWSQFRRRRAFSSLTDSVQLE